MLRSRSDTFGRQPGYPRPMASDHTATLARAWQLVAYFLGERPLPAAPVPPALLQQLATRRRLDAALAEPELTSVSPASCVNAETWREWQAAHSAALARAVWRAEPTRQVFDLLAPTPVIVLKGAAYAELLYPSPGARSMADVDVLVPAEKLQEALAKLEGRGLIRLHPGQATLDAPGYYERQLGRADLALDLHQAFTEPARLAIDYQAVFARALPWRDQASNAFLLSPEDALVYQAIHAGCAEFAPEWAPAMGLLDLRQMVGRRGALWGRAGDPPWT